MFERYVNKPGFVRVPISGNRYFINECGEIRGVDGLEVPQSIDDEGNRVVWADLWDGVGYYKVAVLSISFYKNLRLPFKLWNKIIPLYIDGNRENLHPSNLAYRFPAGGLEHPRHPGMFCIPMYTNYVISISGDLMRVGSTKIRSWHVNSKRGYCSTSVATDIGNLTTAFRHRLMCLAFKEYPSQVDKLDVNHKNGIPGNDWLDNLEWVTRSRNMIHANENYLCQQNIPTLVRDVRTGEVTEYFSLAEVSRTFGLSIPTTRIRVQSKGQKVYDGFFQFKIKSEPLPWKDNIDFSTESNRNRPIVAISIDSGEVTEYRNVPVCEKDLNINRRAVYRKLNTGDERPYRGYVFKWLTDLMSERLE